MDRESAQNRYRGETMIPDDLRRVVDETWISDLEKGFANGANPYFAWLVIASLPQDSWPDWVIDYLGEVADRVLKSDLNKAVSALGIRSPKKSWLKADPLIREWQERKENPERADLSRYWGVDPKSMENEDLYFESRAHELVAEDRGISRLNAREEIAAERGYSSESSHRRGVKRRLKRAQS